MENENTLICSCIKQNENGRSIICVTMRIIIYNPKILMTSYVNVLMQATKSKRKECNLCQDRDNYLQFQNIYE